MLSRPFYSAGSLVYTSIRSIYALIHDNLTYESHLCLFLIFSRLNRLLRTNLLHISYTNILTRGHEKTNAL